jgi:hypothetical protein
LDVATDQLDKLIERRSDAAPDPDELEPSYAESVRRYHARRRNEDLWQRLRFHERMLANHTAAFQAILDRHRAGVLRCEAMLEIQSSNGKETA